MRIALLYAQWDGELGWSTPVSLQNAFERLGHVTEHFNLYFRGRRGEYSDFHFREFLSRQNEFDFMILMDYGPFNSQFLDSIQIPCVYEAGDDPQSHGLHAPKAHFFDIILSPDRRCVDKYVEWGHDAFWWPHFCDTDLHVDLGKEPDKFLVTTINEGRGGKFEDCGMTVIEYLDKHLGDDFLIDRYFHGFEHTEFMNRGVAVLQKSAYGEVTRRPFEAAACGRLVILDELHPSTGMDTIFRPNIDAIYYKHPKEVVEFVKDLKANPEKAKKIAESGKQRVLEAHTADHRAKFVVDKVELFLECQE